MNNWKRYKERLDVWVVRYSSEAAHRYWGFTNFALHDARHVVDLLQVWAILCAVLGALPGTCTPAPYVRHAAQDSINSCVQDAMLNCRRLCARVPACQRAF